VRAVAQQVHGLVAVERDRLAAGRPVDRDRTRVGLEGIVEAVRATLPNERARRCGREPIGGRGSAVTSSPSSAPWPNASVVSGTAWPSEKGRRVAAAAFLVQDTSTICAERSS
jgi:hypothetical protein